MSDENKKGREAMKRAIRQGHARRGWEQEAGKRIEGGGGGGKKKNGEKRASKVGGAGATLPPAARSVAGHKDSSIRYPRPRHDEVYWRSRFKHITEVCEDLRGPGSSRHSKLLADYLMDDIIRKYTDSMWTYQTVVLKVESVLDDLKDGIHALRRRS